MTEAQIQTKIKTRMEKAGWMVIKIIQCNRNGFPDLMCLKGGKTLFIEVKKPTTNPTDLQEYIHEKLREQGFEVLVLRD
jgi:Holliday junction resolvase